MLTGGIAVAMALVALTPVLPQIDAALAHNADDRLLVKLLVTVTGLTMVIGAPLAGFLTDRYGVRRILLLFGLVFAVGGTAGLYLDSLPVLLVSRLLVGAASGAIAAISMTMINTRLVGNDRAKWMGGHVAVASLCALAIHPLAGFVGEFGWRWPFALYGLGLLFSVLALFGTDEVKVAAAPGVSTDRAALLSWFPKRFIFLALFIGAITYLPVVYVPFVLRNAGVSSPLVISMVGFGDSILSASMSLLFARSQRWFSSRAGFLFSFACTGLGLSIVTVWPSVLGVFVGMGVFGLGIGWFVPNLMTAAASLVGPDQQGRTVGIVKAAHYMAAPLCVVLVEPITRRFGPTSALTTAAVIAFVLLVIFAVRLATLRRAPG